MSLSRWKELAQRKTKAGKAVNELYDDITEEKIRSKTTDQAIAKTFRLDKLDRLDEIAEQTKPRKRIRRPAPRINPDEDIDYAPEVDPYEDMDVEGLLTLEDYVPPQREKQIAPKPPKYEMDPSYWQIDPPEYEEIDPLAEDTKAIEAPPEFEGAEEDNEANKILDHLELPNYDDVEKRLVQPDMNETKGQTYIDKVVKDAEKRRRQVIAMKSDATKKFKKGAINAAERDRIHQNADRFRIELNNYIKTYRFKSKSVKGYGTKRGSGVVFYNNPEELLKKLAIILAEMEAGNTSIEMRNMGQNILDTLLKNKNLNKASYQKIVRKYFPL